MVSFSRISLKPFQKWKQAWFLPNFGTRLPPLWNGFLRGIKYLIGWFWWRVMSCMLYGLWFPQASHHVSQQTQCQLLGGYQGLETHSPPSNHTPKVSIIERSSTLKGLGCGATPWVLSGLRWVWVVGWHPIFQVPMCLGCTQWLMELLPKGLP